MGTFPKAYFNRKSTAFRNMLRGLTNRLTLVTKDDETGLEDDIVTSNTIADGAVLEAALGNASVSMAKCKFPVTGVNLLPKKYSSFSALEGSAPSADLYVVSGAASALARATGEKFYGTHSLQATITGASNLTFALCTGSSDYPVNALGGALGTHHILSFYYKRGGTSGHTFVAQLRFSDASTQTISGTLTPTTSWQRYVSTPFTLNSTSLAYRVEMVVTGSTLRAVYLAEMMLNCTGSDANVTEVGLWIPGGYSKADDVDNRTCRILSSNIIQDFAGNALIDRSKFDLSGRLVTLRQTSADLAVANLIHDDGSGLEKDNTTIDLKIASGKKFTVGSTDIIDASANLALASGKTVTVGSKTYIDSSGIVKYAAKTRVLWMQEAYSASGAATEAEAVVTNTSYQAVAIFAVKKYADDRKIRVTCQAKTDADVSHIGNVQISFTNGGGSYTGTSANINGTTYTDTTATIDVTSGGGSGEELTYCTISVKCAVAGAISMRRCVCEMLSEDV